MATKSLRKPPSNFQGNLQVSILANPRMPIKI
ncbi:hypothetical protein CCACVL1_25848 [Corchorus capsularis]|uniref:Uncharacterized protein n=1 Tax=Corchorus capsularis TaxID=210143 RepID=A0A1R3GGT7_COCAP|nr:hypothetical protein CCACVL1_25848 [Corchorus capsularis]